MSLMTYNEAILLFESDFWIVYLSKEQSYLGRSSVKLKRPCKNLSELSPEEWLDFGIIVKKFEFLLGKTFGATMFNWTCMMNNAYKNEYAAQVHWHVRPRYADKVSLGDSIFNDPNFGHHYIREVKNFASDKFVNLVAEKLKKNI